MMLDNRGWSLKEMLFLSAILLFFVLLVAVLVGKLYDGLTPVGSDKQNSYAQVETNLKNAGKKYYSNNRNENFVTSDILLSENLIKLSDLTVKNDICEGYVIINNGTLTPYIKCKNYETKGY